MKYRDFVRTLDSFFVIYSSEGKDAKELKLAKNMPMFSSVEAIHSKMLTLLIGKLFLEISFGIVFLVPRNGFDFESSTKFY